MIPGPGLLASLEEALRAAALQIYGPTALKQSRLVPAIRKLSALYNGDDPLPAQLDPLPRLLFFTLADLPKAAVAVTELALAGRLPTPPPGGVLRVLDLGAGFGAQTLGTLAALAHSGRSCPVEVLAVDQDAEALRGARAVLHRCQERAGLGQQLVLETRRLRLGGDLGELGGPYHLILAGTLLNELPETRRLPLVRQLMGQLEAEGHLLLIEPALRHTARALHQLRDALLRPPDPAAAVVAPCTHQLPCPMLRQDGDWCHERRPWDPPPAFAGLARASGLRRGTLRWSYLSLCRPEHAPQRQPPVPWRVVSDALPSKGRLELLLCGEGRCLRARRLNRHRAPGNRAFQRLRRGDLALVEGAECDTEGGLVVVQNSQVSGWDPATTRS